MTVDRPSAFMSPEWVEAWVEVLGPDLRPEALVWTDSGGRPVACAIVSVDTVRVGPFRLSRLFLNASGVGEPGCEHNDVPCVPRHREDVIDDLVRICRERGTDELALVGITKSTAENLVSRWSTSSLQGYFSEAPYVSLERLRESGTSYLDSLSSNTRTKVQRSIRLYEERHGTAQLDVAGREEVGDWFARMIALHEERWRARGSRGAFAREAIRRFHARLFERCVGSTGRDRLGVDLARVRFGDQVVGYLQTLRFRGHVSYYQCGFRYEADNRLKPGLVSHALAVEHYLAEGEDEYDFLGGEPDPVRYKRSLSTDVRCLAWIRLPAPSAKMRLLGALWRSRARARWALG